MDSFQNCDSCRKITSLLNDVYQLFSLVSTNRRIIASTEFKVMKEKRQQADILATQ
jgi:predicted anti-sigma-YlaC factor YlaD